MHLLVGDAERTRSLQHALLSILLSSFFLLKASSSWGVRIDFLN